VQFAKFAVTRNGARMLRTFRFATECDSDPYVGASSDNFRLIAARHYRTRDKVMSLEYLAHTSIRACMSMFGFLEYYFELGLLVSAFGFFQEQDTKVVARFHP
jgi:hypothetical protein